MAGFPTTSTVFGTNVVSALNNSIALNLSDATANVFRYALFGNNLASAPVFSTDTGDYGAGAWATSGEVAASGTYATGGFALSTPVFGVNTAVSGARMLWRESGASSHSITSYTGTPYGGLAYWDPTTDLSTGTDYGIVCHYFGSGTGIPVSTGTLNLTWNSTYVAGTLFYIPFA